MWLNVETNIEYLKFAEDRHWVSKEEKTLFLLEKTQGLVGETDAGGPAPGPGLGPTSMPMLECG